VFFNIILARRGMHVGMGMRFAGQNTEWQPRMRMSFIGRGNGRTQNDSLPLPP
jgi:hypothetical protein